MNDLLQQGIAAVKAGDRDTGKRLLAHVLHADLNNEIAWLWMAYAVDDIAQRHECLERVLQINPDNERARQSLEKLRPISLLESTETQNLADVSPEPETGLALAVQRSAAAPPRRTDTIAGLRTRVSRLETKRKAVYKRRSNLLLAGFVTLVFLLLFQALIASDHGHRPTSSICFLGLAVSILAVGVPIIVRARSQIRVLGAQIKAERAKLAGLEQERGELLGRIGKGDLGALSAFGVYVFQKLPIDLLPDQNKLAFRLKKGETCFLQIEGTRLGRMDTRMITRKTGGGYRAFGVYMPVQKERARVTEMNVLDAGTLAITSQRILFLGAVRKLSIGLDKILELRALEDALAVTKEGRQSADFFLDVDGELLAATIDGIESV